MEPVASDGRRRDDDQTADEPSLQEQRKRLAARELATRERYEASAKRRLALLNSMSRTFASTMRATLIERKRFAEERERLLERERAARTEAEASRKRLHDVLESIDDAFSALDRQWRYTYANDRAVEFADRPREELLGKSVWEVFPELTGGAAYAELRRAAEEGIVTHFEHYSERLERWLHYRAYPSSAGLCIYTTDITERKNAEEELREREEEYRATFELAGVGKAQAELTTGRFLRVNRRLCEITGYEPEELVVQTFAEITHPEDRDGSHADLSRMARGEIDEYETEKRYVRKDGAVIWVRVNATAIRELRGQPLRTVATIEDITKRKQAEEERERLLAHQWAARAGAEERKRISRELHDRVAHSMGVVHQSLELYEALKERSPSEAEGKIELAREMVKEAIDSTRALSRELRDPEVKDNLSSALSNLCRTTIPPDLECNISVEGNESLVSPHVREQLFLILREGVRNTVSHSGASDITIRVGVDPEKVVGSVEDNGRGFAEEDGSSSNGIRSMRERAELVGGTFDLSSTPGTGTTIEAFLPLKEDPAGWDAKPSIGRQG